MIETTSKKKDQRRISVRKCKIIFSCVSAILIPLLLGTFTIVLTLQQDSIAKANRQVDLRIAADQHQQNQEATLDEQQQTQFIAYIREIADLLLIHNFTLDWRLLSIIVRPKTLATLRQLDPVRKTYLLWFLHESRLISKQYGSYLNLDGADFNSIRMGVKTTGVDMRRTAFSGISLENASLSYMSFGGSDFSGARLCRASLKHINCEYCNFYIANLEEARFDQVTLFQADFTNANLRNSNISQDQIAKLGSYSGAIMPDGRLGRNTNLLPSNLCETITNGGIYRQNFSVLPNRWFRERDYLSLNITDFNDQGDILRRICKRKIQLNSSTHDHQDCTIQPWLSLMGSPKTSIDQNHTIAEKFNIHNETSNFSIDIQLELHSSCRDLYFSIETA